MKLVKLALTPPLVAISVALCAALSSFGAMHYSSVMSVPGFTDEEATLNDFPLLVRISPAAIEGFAYDLCQADGKDIRFTSLDGATVYPHEIDEWNTDGESLVWVRIPALAKGCQFKFWFGDSSVTAAPAYTTNGAVWKGANYFGVYHMNETAGSGTADFLCYDSSRYGFDLTPKKGSGDLTKMTTYAGCVGRARANSNTNTSKGNMLKASADSDWLEVGDTFTVSGWFNMSVANADQYMICRKNSAGTAEGWSIRNGNGGNVKIRGASSTDASINVDNFQNKWTYLTVVFDGTTVTVYSKGVRKGAGTIAAATESGRCLAIGNTVSQDAACFSGRYDEIRLMDGVQSAAWIAADYACQNAADYVTAAAVTEETVANTLTVVPSSGLQKGTVTPAYGVSAIAAGTVSCTAPADPIDATETERFQYTGWKLTQVSASGAATVTTGEGATCVFTHNDGDAVTLEWQNGCFYKVDVSATDTDYGAVSGGGWLAEGTTATLAATPNAGGEFCYWQSVFIPMTDCKTTPFSFSVAGPVTATATFCALRYRWASPVAGNWKTASCWKDLDGDGTGDIPPADGTATVVLPTPASGNYKISIDDKYTIDLKGIVVEPTDPTKNAYSGPYVQLAGGHNSRTVLTLHEGGLCCDPSVGAGKIQLSTLRLNIACDQVWNLNPPVPYGDENYNGWSAWQLSLNGVNVYADAGVNWDILGDTVLRFANNTKCPGTNFHGNFRTNARIARDGVAPAFIDNVADDATVTISIKDYPNAPTYHYAGTTSGRLDISRTTGSVGFAAPITIADNDATHPGFALWISENSIPYTVNVNLANDWTMDIKRDGQFMFMAESYGTASFFTNPDVQKYTVSGDNSGLVAAEGVEYPIYNRGCPLVLASANALGKGNSLGVSFFCPVNGKHDYALQTLTAHGGIDVASDVLLNDTTSTASSLAVYLGAVTEGTSVYSGNVVNGGNNYIRLTSAANAVSRFTGAFTDASTTVLPLEACGEGDVELSGDNSALTKGVNVRAGRLLAGNDTALGTGAVNVGGTVPEVVEVRAYSYGVASSTFTNGGSPVVDGVTLEPGEKVLFRNQTNSGGSYGGLMTYNGLVNNKHNYTFSTAEVPTGSRIKVKEGMTYAGLIFESVSASRQYPEAQLNPDAKLLAKNGVTIANDINVTDNKSTGVSAIGSADASTVTFSGAITLAKDVVFEAAEGSTVNVTGTIDAGDFKVAGFSGLGTVNFANGLDVADQALRVVLQADAVPAEGLAKYTLATGLSGTPTAITLATADGSAVPEGWNVHKVGSKLVFKNNLSGAAILIR